MPYAVTADMIARFGTPELDQLADNGSGAVNTVMVDGACADASREIDAYLSVKYAMPLATVPPVLVRLTCDIARYRLYDAQASAEVRNRYNDAVALLVRIANGTASLGLPDTTPALGEHLPQFTTRIRQFTDDTLDAFARDYP